MAWSGLLVVAAWFAADASSVALSPRIANYDMDVRLDTSARTLHGTQVLTWRNSTAVATKELRYHLYYNAWRNDRSSWFRTGQGLEHDLSHVRDGEWAYSEVATVELLEPGGAVALAHAFVQPDDSNPDDRTVLRVELPRAIGPGEAVDVRLTWTAKVPRTFARTGVRGDYYFLAQWFPKVGVLEADGSWNCHQFIQTEFYADFGVYDVRLTVPQDWVVGATGTQHDRTDNGDGTATHRYVQADVHDFAWTTSPDFAVHEQVFEAEGLPTVAMRLLLQPDHSDKQRRYFEATRAALELYGTWWGAYPYDHITIVDPAYGSRSGGMEYPTLFTGGTRWLSPRERRSPEGVTVHEAGHQFWYGIMANNEFEHAWLDEGFNTYSTTRVMKRAFPDHAYVKRYFEDFIPVVFSDVVPSDRTDGGDRHRGFESVLKRDPQRRPSWRTGPDGYRVNAYDKGALTLRTLENYLGWPTFQRVMAPYFERYRFDHPRPEDFFTMAQLHSGVDLQWFFDQAWGASVVFDYGVGRVESVRERSARGWVDTDSGLVLADRDDSHTTHDAGQVYESVVHVRRWGGGVFPVAVEVTFEDGYSTIEHWGGDERWTRYAYKRPGRVDRVRVDPDHHLVLDLNYTNNGWVRESQAATASVKWSSKWMVWLQATLEAFAFFG